MRTIEDLKANRNVLIQTINDNYGPEFVKPIMAAMLDAIGFNGYFEMDAVRFTHAVVKDFDLYDSVIIKRGIAASATLSEMNRNNAIKMISIR